MKKRAFTAMALGLATAFSTPACFAQGSSAEHAHHDQLGSKTSVSAQDVTPLKEIRASKLIGINVTSKDGDNLGQVQDLIFNPRTGKIRFALVGKGFMAGAGENLIPIPWQAVNVKSEHEFALNVDKSKLKSAPNWNQSSMDQPDYVIRIYRFYELEPQSEVGSPGSSETESGQGQGNSSDPGSKSQAQPEHQPKE